MIIWVVDKLLSPPIFYDKILLKFIFFAILINKRQLMAENNSLIEVHEGRKHIYYFLSRFYIYIPDENLF